MIAIVVSSCSSCPFASAEDQPWLCDALGASDGESDPREIPSTGERWTGTPEWCPLRTSDRIVTLKRPR